MASRFGPAQPRGTVWNGAGACEIFSQLRQVNFSRTVWITFHRRGIACRAGAVRVAWLCCAGGFPGRWR